MVQIPEMSGLTFEERGHVYKLDGVIIPSVTTLMKPISEKVYGSVDEDILQMAASRGTAIHNAIENYLKYGIEDIEPSAAGYFEAFQKWYVKQKPKVIATEQRVYHKTLAYAGTSDLVAEIDGMTMIVDYKSSYKVQEALCALQLEAYARAFESHDVKIDGRMILHLKKDGTYKEISFPKDTKKWVVFTSLVSIDRYVRAM